MTAGNRAGLAASRACSGSLRPERMMASRLLATAGGDGTARLWDPVTGEHLRILTGRGAGLGGGVQPGRAAARHRQRRQDGTAVD